MRRVLLAVFCLAALLAPLPCLADVTLPNVFSDNMVLQRDAAVPVWGKAAPGEKVTVTIAGKSASAVTGPDGRWMAKLPALTTGGPFELVVSGANTVTIKTVLVGEVWLASGQSNMAFSVRRAKDGRAEVAAAGYPRIRLLKIYTSPAPAPKDDIDARWTECSPATAGDFSAVAYYFARDIHKTLDVPIGIIDNSLSGSVAEAWMSPEALESHRADLAPLLDHWREVDATAGMAPAPSAVPSTASSLRRRRAESGLSMHHPSALYNNSVAPIVPFAIRGVIWYQGEGNSGRAFQYKTLFPALIADWRALWGQGDFPFLYVQLANYRERRGEPAESTWAELREVQLQTLSVPNTGMASAVDVGDPSDPHPLDKQTVGHRLALVARALVYGEKVEYSGPLFAGARFENGKAVVDFTHVNGGLVAKDGRPEAFQIAGADRKFVWAEARVEGDTVVVSSPQIAEPVSVRYAWQDNPPVTLYNREGLPASPFRTDDWLGIPHDEFWAP